MKARLLLLLLLGCRPNSGLQADQIDSVPEHNISIHLDYPETLCPADTVYINWKSKSFCIDKYEYPNIVGQYPEYALSAFDAEKLCVSAGKRLCSYDEWHRACVGAHNNYYSYGPRYIRGLCNDDKGNYIQPNWALMFSPRWKSYALSLYKGEPSGNRPLCHTDEGVYDLPANVREWVKDPQGLNGYSVPSGYWYATMMGPENCSYVIRNHAASFASYEFGARCCLNPQNK